MSRFDYIAYDRFAQETQEQFKSLVLQLEALINATIVSPRAKALAITKLEEVYMWIGKAIRDDQIMRNSAQEGRSDG